VNGRVGRRALQSLFLLNDGPWRWSVGIQAALAMGVPLALFTIAGRQSYGLIASLGGFLALYFASLRRIDRLRVLPMIMVGLICASALGVVCSVNVWANIVCLIAVTALASVLAIGFAIGPPGPLMFVLVAGVSGFLAERIRVNQAALDELAIPVLVAFGALCAYLVTIAPLVLPSVRRHEGPPAKLRIIFPRFHVDALTRQLVIRIVIAASIAGVLSAPLGAHRTYWAVLAAIAVLQVSNSRHITTLRAVHRVLGTILGLGIFGLLALKDIDGFGLVIAVMLLQFLIEVVVARNYGIALVFITPVALLISTAGQQHGLMPTVQGRVFDTLLGATIALAVFWGGEWLSKHRGNEMGA